MAGSNSAVWVQPELVTHVMPEPPLYATIFFAGGSMLTVDGDAFEVADALSRREES